MNRQDLANQRTFMRAMRHRRSVYMLKRDDLGAYHDDNQPALFGSTYPDPDAKPFPVVDTTPNRRDEDAK